MFQPLFEIQLFIKFLRLLLLSASTLLEILVDFDSRTPFSGRLRLQFQPFLRFWHSDLRIDDWYRRVHRISTLLEILEILLRRNANPNARFNPS
jgi:hypothetical protein